MRFLFKMAFWLGVIAILLPRAESQPASNAQISATDAMSAATATVGDMRQFCGRQPEACTVGSQAAVALEDRAKAGAKRLYEMLNERLSANDSNGVAAATAKNATPVPLPTARPPQHAAQARNAPQSTSQAPSQATSQNTLTPADLAPAWRGPPPPRKDPHERPA
jgi:hypothetical protein